MNRLTILSIMALFLLSSLALTPCLADSDKGHSEGDKDSGHELGDKDSEHEFGHNDSDHLVVLWTSGDKDVAMKMVFMYVYNAKKYGWWEDITLIVWGPSSKLASEDADIQDYIKKMIADGITIKACKACADLYEVSGALTAFGIEVKYMGTDLTEYIKAGKHVITF
ncbi:MAG: DsrE family protein [candidate division Zixibacteria bacterium]